MPVAGVVKKLAGDVGDQIAIGSVWSKSKPKARTPPRQPAQAEAEEIPLADGAAVPTQAQEEANPTLEVADEPPSQPSTPSPLVPSEVKERVSKREGASTSLGTNGTSEKSQILTTPAVRARARDLGIDLAQVKHQGEHIRHADLDAYLLYNGGQVSGRATGPLRQDEQIKVVGLRRKIAENMQAAKRQSRTSPLSRSLTSPRSKKPAR